jgi:signal transduction histidine kinase/ActR/RegA family two-component response regulator
LVGDEANLPIGDNKLERCANGDLVCVRDMSTFDTPLVKLLTEAGLRSLVGAPLLTDGRTFALLVVAREEVNAFSHGDCEFLRQLTEHVSLAAHQAQLYTALQQAYEKLQQTQQAVMQQERLRAVGQMASGIAHDINNALSPAALYTQSLLETEQNLSERARNYLETTQRAIEDVAHTVGRLRDFYRPREPQTELVPVALNDLVTHAIDLTRARWCDMPMQRGIVIEAKSELAPDLPLINGVASEIREALVNLILNAVDAMPDGGNLTLRTKVAKAQGNAAVPRVALEVEDNGAGMDEDTRRRCLEPFFTTKGERGTGLGLAMVYGIAQRHGAELEVKSAPGKGTAISISFPLTGLVPEERRTADHQTGRAQGLRLLLVDDDILVLRSLSAILEADGHTVTTANGGQSGIDALKVASERGEVFSAVITDLGMPHVDGRKVAATVKAVAPETRVVLLTGWGQSFSSPQSVSEHVDSVLSKPPRLADIRAALAQLCSC